MAKFVRIPFCNQVAALDEKGERIKDAGGFTKYVWEEAGHLYINPDLVIKVSPGKEAGSKISLLSQSGSTSSTEVVWSIESPEQIVARLIGEGM